jgi:hypothetical protein
MSNAYVREFTPFDELRNDPDIKKRGRADIVFGPDMFDPRIVDGYTPLGDAFDAALEEGKLADLGLTEESRGMTVEEVWGDISSAELTERCLEVSSRLEPKPLPSPPSKDFLKWLLSSAD